MRPDSNEYIVGIVEDCSFRLGGRLAVGTTRPIDPPGQEERVADAAQAFLVDGASRADDCVLIVSNPAYPDFVKQAVDKAREAQSLLGGTLGQAVCAPILAGARGGRSYAVYRRLDGFSPNRYLRRLQILSSGRTIFDWLSDVFRTTGTECRDAGEQERDFLAPLRTLAADRNPDDRVGKSALALWQQASRGEARMFRCLQHGDFWFGNVLFCRSAASGLSPFRNRFQIIDWGGSNPGGYPGMDALRFALSAFGPGRAAADRLRLFCAAIGLTRLEFSLSCFCALGWLASNLNQFPKDRFDDLAADLASFLSQHGFLDGR